MTEEMREQSKLFTLLKVSSVYKGFVNFKENCVNVPSNQLFSLFKAILGHQTPPVELLVMHFYS